MLRYGVVTAAVALAGLVGAAGVAAGPAAAAPRPASGGPRAVPDAIVSAGPPPVDLASYVVADSGGRILAEQAPHEQHAPASTLKVLTADTLMPQLDPATTVTPAAAADFTAEPDGSVVGMATGVTYSVADLWHAVFLVSGNDAIAELAHLSGGTDHTIALMRSEAEALGADDTVVGDADGYDVPGQVTSAYDMALFARAGLRMAQFRADCGLRSASFPGPGGTRSVLDSHDPMLLHYPGMIGIKGGITTIAGHTYIGAATRGGRTVIVTAMHGGTDIWDQVTKLMDWGFAADGTVAGVGWLTSGPGPSAAPAPAAPVRVTGAATVPPAGPATPVRSGVPGPTGPTGASGPAAGSAAPTEATAVGSVLPAAEASAAGSAGGAAAW